MDRGMISPYNLAFLSEAGRRYLLATHRKALAVFDDELRCPGWQRLPDNPDVEVKVLVRPHQDEDEHGREGEREREPESERIHYLLARSRPRRHKERAIRRRQRRALAKGLKKLQARVARGRLKKRDKIHEAIGRITGRYPKARSF